MITTLRPPKACAHVAVEALTTKHTQTHLDRGACPHRPTALCLFRPRSPCAMAPQAANGDSSDDDAYNGVDLISESDDDERALESKEETIIAREVDGSGRDGSDGPTALEDDDVLDDIDLPDLGDGDLPTYFSNAIDALTPPDMIDAAFSAKRVHFEDDFVNLGDESADASSFDEQGLGALYMPQDELDPMFRAQMEADLYDDEGVGEDDTYHDPNAGLPANGVSWSSPSQNVVGGYGQASVPALRSHESKYRPAPRINVPRWGWDVP